MRIIARLAAAMVLSTGAVHAGADVVVLEAAADNTLYENSDGLSNGSGPNFYVGETNSFGSRRGLLRFDFQGSIPPGSEIHSVSLRLYMSRTTSGLKTVQLKRVLQSWGEGASNSGPVGGGGALAQPGDATWSHRFFDDLFWDTTGGDFSPAASGAQGVSGVGFYTWSSTSGLVQDVQGWVDVPSSNHGWLVQGPENGAASAKRFESREAEDTEQRPRLTIDFTPGPTVPATGAWGVVALGLSLLAAGTIVCGVRRAGLA